ncbi:MAG: hypothetical protein ABW157_12050 [Candidatus Thiodiazotropha sp. LLP2]
MVGGVVGGMFGGPMGAQLGSQIGGGIGGMLEGLISNHGQSNVQGAMNNNMMGSLVGQLGQAIQSAPGIPQFARDEMCQALNDVQQSCPAEPTPPGCQQDTDDSMSGLIDKIVDKVVDQIMEKLQGGGCESGGDLQDMVRQAIEDVVREQIGGGAEDGDCAANGGASTAEPGAGGAADSSDSCAETDYADGARALADSGDEDDKKGTKGGSTNWLVALATAMGKIAGQHLEKMMEAQDDMENSNTDTSEMSEADAAKAEKEDGKKFTEAQSRFQAESKLFAMTTEATSTALKSIGDGLSSLARKQ